MAEPDLAEQVSAIERAQERASLAAARSARWNGVSLIFTGIFMGGFAAELGSEYTPPLGMAIGLCLIAFVIWQATQRGTRRRHWRRASLVAIIAGLVFYVAGFAVFVFQSLFGHRIVGSSPAFWILDGVLTALPLVIVGLWEARPRRSPSRG
jgi:biotin transporter BioY